MLCYMITMKSRSVLVLFLINLVLMFSLCNSSPLLLPLSHTLSDRRGTHSIHHLLKSTAAASSARFRHHRQVSLPLSPGSDYTLSLTLNGQPASLYMDTGSDVVWLPCKPFECILCDDKQVPSHTTPPLNLSGASVTSVGCSSTACSAVHGSLSSSDLCAMAKCPLDSIEMSQCDEASYPCPPFYYAYGDGSFIAKLYKSTLTVSSKLSISNFTFGCAHTALGEPVGVAGFGRGSLSLPAQLARESPDIGNYFSYCLISHGFDAERARQLSPLILGRYDNNQKKKKIATNNTITGSSSNDDELIQDEDGDRVDYVYTPMLENPKHSYFYCVGLEAVSIGKTRIEAMQSLKRVDSKGNGGMVVDSGTTYTMLPRKFYRAVVSEFHARMGASYQRATSVEQTSGLSPCYYVDGKSKAAFKNVANVPRLVFHFGGGNNSSSVVMPRRNYFYEFEDGGREVGCLMVMDGGDEAETGGGPAGLLGNYQQQGFEVVYDLVKNRVGFARRKCAALWETLN